MKKIRAVDIETGEDLSGQYRLVNRKSAESYQRLKQTEEARSRGRSHDFTFSVMDALGEVTSVLTNAQCGYLFVLQGYAEYNGRICKSGEIPMKTSDMAQALRLGERSSTFYDFLSKALNNEIISEADGIYSINQRYHFRGPINGRNAVQSFTKSVRSAYRENKAEDLGVIYRMLPFVSRYYNTLCHNPDEKVAELVKPLKAKEIAEITGVTPSDFSRRWKRLVFDGSYVLAKVSVGNRTSYMFNPFIIHRGKDMTDDTARGIFAVKPKS